MGRALSDEKFSTLYHKIDFKKYSDVAGKEDIDNVELSFQDKLHWPTKNTFFQNMFKIFTHSGAE